jgi:ABC-type nitrate/sulfonate/bicarbonate transport system substrate-binding protein
LEIAMAALDNAVAMIQVAKHDVVIVAGGDSGMNEFFVQPYINAFPDLRGRILVVDAPDTAYALLAKKILLGYGLKDGADYTVKAVGGGVLRLKALQEDKNNAAAVMNLPYSILAEQSGLKSLGRTVDMLGPYQANGMYVMRAWAAANGAALERYIAAYVEALRWALDPANKAAAIALLQEKLKLDRGVADPSFGFTPDARLDLVGFRNMLALRGEIEGGPVPEPGKYLDLGYYERAVKTLAAKP